MKNWKHPFSIVALSTVLVALAPSVASAENNCCNDPCQSRCCDFGSFEIGVDFLYWKPCVSDLDYVGVETHQDPKKINIRSIDTDWEPGVRAFLKIPSCTCDWDVEASYTYIESRNTESRKVPQDDDDMLPVNSHPNFTKYNQDYQTAKGKWNAEYQEWEVLFVYNLHNTKCHKFSSFFGIAGIELDQKLHIELTDDDLDFVTTDWKGDYWGVGFRAGTQYEYNFSDCFSFFTRAHGTVLAGEPKKVRYHNTFIDCDGDGELIVSDDNRCQIVPGFNIGAGFAYNTSYCDTDWSLRVGYQFLEWFNLPRHRTFVGGADQGTIDRDVVLSTSSASTGRSLGFHGLTAGISLAF